MWVRRGFGLPAESGTREMKPSGKLPAIENIKNSTNKNKACINLEKSTGLKCKVYSEAETYYRSRLPEVLRNCG